MSKVRTDQTSIPRRSTCRAQLEDQRRRYAGLRSGLHLCCILVLSRNRCGRVGRCHRSAVSRSDTTMRDLLWPREDGTVCRSFLTFLLFLLYLILIHL
jgi:hypothetical protein